MYPSLYSLETGFVRHGSDQIILREPCYPEYRMAALGSQGAWTGALTYALTAVYIRHSAYAVPPLLWRL
jgi:hypothetical protein